MTAGAQYDPIELPFPSNTTAETNPLSKMQSLSTQVIAEATGYSESFVLSAFHAGAIPGEQSGKKRNIRFRGADFHKIQSGLDKRADSIRSRRKATGPTANDLQQLREEFATYQFTTNTTIHELESRISHLEIELSIIPR